MKFGDYSSSVANAAAVGDAPGLVATQSRLVAERCDTAIYRVSGEKRKCEACA